MFTSLLVGLDGSPPAQVALAQAIRIGQAFRARIVVAYVAPMPGHTAEMALGAPWMEWTPQDARAGRTEREIAVREMLRDAAGAVRRAGLEVETVFRTGEPVDVLRELAENVGVVLVGRSGIRGARQPEGEDVLGPGTRELIRRCPRPVLVCGGQPTPMDRVLVAYGGGPASEGALAFAARFAGITGAHLDVLHVARDSEAGKSTLARASGALSLMPLDFDTHLVEGELEPSITATVTRLGSNALFAGAHRQDAGWLVPSHTEIILRATGIPVLVHMPVATPSARVSAAHRRPAS
ncbi:MAG TPA: universal stress protein [Gemmatimonadales bacterium]|nr:universal stress protein [Gemmatimonadales bacterium]